MKHRFNKELYPKVCILKAAYHFTDRAYFHLDISDEYYVVEITPKEGFNLGEQEFENELLAQSVRYEIYQQTREIRKMTLARALATSVVETAEEDSELEAEKPITSEDQILQDWFSTERAAKHE